MRALAAILLLLASVAAPLAQSSAGSSGGGGGGGTANPYPGADYATTARQDAQTAALGAVGDAAYSGSGNAGNVALGKGQYAILSNLYAAIGTAADTASTATGANGSQTALLKALRDRLAGTLTVSGTVGLSGTLPSFAATPTVNLGTLNGVALDTSVQAVKTALGSPFQAGGSIANTAFGISGTLPAFAATPTVNLGTIGGGATAANQATELSSLATIAVRASFNSEFSTATTASQSVLGAVRDLGASPAYSRISAGGNSTQAGTLNLLGCYDSGCSGTFIIASQAIVAGGNGVVSYPAVTRWWRVQFVNGTTAGAVNASSSAPAN